MWANEQRPINGVVVSADGTPVAGATVRSLSTDRATTTNDRGEFTLDAGEGEKLTVSYVGYVTQEVAVSGVSLRITLAEASN